MKLNLGAGTDIRPDFLNVDIKNLPGINIVSDASNLPSLEDNSVEFIVAQHLLEYIPRANMTMALHEWKRLLKKHASLEIRVTDFAQLTKALYLNTVSPEMGLHHEMVLALIYGHQIDKNDIRFNGFTSEFLQGVLTGVDLKIINVVIEDYDLIVTAIKQ